MLCDAQVIVGKPEMVGEVGFEKLGLKNGFSRQLPHSHAGALARMPGRLAVAKAVGWRMYIGLLQHGGWLQSSCFSYMMFSVSRAQDSITFFDPVSKVTYH